MQKPVHIVPMWDSKARVMRDVIMPGVGSYRTQAARSGQYAGVSEPEYGPDVTEQVGGFEITYPAWCRVIVKRLLPNNMVAEFSAIERWKENYATAGKDSQAPNAMWKRRPYAQLAKCAEAQALRKAFPEFGSQPTADEMEGKILEDGGTVIDGSTGEIVSKPQKPEYSAADFNANFPTWEGLIKSGRKVAESIIRTVESRNTLTEEQKASIRAVKKDDPTGEMTPEEIEAARQRELDESEK